VPVVQEQFLTDREENGDNVKVMDIAELSLLQWKYKEVDDEYTKTSI
jgi:hypothetical protein